MGPSRRRGLPKPVTETNVMTQRNQGKEASGMVTGQRIITIYMGKVVTLLHVQQQKTIADKARQVEDWPSCTGIWQHAAWTTPTFSCPELESRLCPKPAQPVASYLSLTSNSMCAATTAMGVTWQRVMRSVAGSHALMALPPFHSRSR